MFLVWGVIATIIVIVCLARQGDLQSRVASGITSVILRRAKVSFQQSDEYRLEKRPNETNQSPSIRAEDAYEAAVEEQVAQATTELRRYWPEVRRDYEQGTKVACFKHRVLYRCIKLRRPSGQDLTVKHMHSNN
jgi:hypothetical protein